MAVVKTTRMSSRGQVVIPDEVRRRLGLRAGSEFVVVGEGSVVLLKTVAPPSLAEVGDLLSQARKQARRAGLRRADVAAAIAKVRATAAPPRARRKRAGGQARGPTAGAGGRSRR
jgi:AbrB family looped-hinge helix DNA binding protein